MMGVLCSDTTVHVVGNNITLLSAIVATIKTCQLMTLLEDLSIKGQVRRQPLEYERAYCKRATRM
jgi:hypothetical protein